MAEKQDVFGPPSEFSEKAWIGSLDEYRKIYRRSLDDPEGFWSEMAEQFHWAEKWNKAASWDFGGEVSIRFFEGGKTNVCYNALDRHVEAGKGDRVAFYWEGNDPDEQKTITYAELLDQVKRFANVLRSLGVGKGDRVSLYLPMIPELAVAMLACARIGAIHSVVFGGFSADALADRIMDAECKLLVTVDGSFRGKKTIPLK
ncbi:MAG: acetyl-coenzyme A synthetase, partial [Deltaproteobacteria bacterium]